MNRTMNRFTVLTLTLLTAGATGTQANLLINAGVKDSIPFFGWTRFGAGSARIVLLHMYVGNEQNGCSSCFDQIVFQQAL